ncbi:Glycoside hydrolase, 38 vacuolar alpha mannosidase [Haplosporangium sp. Z 27]|nr:Glycoside hydrolase, 38 vacuolar alpha mannosidase [Haplosporangium sp. Z 27]
MAPCETIKKNNDLAFSNQSLMPYGNGDGGGGPQRAMLERIRRMNDIDGLPRCEMGGAETFFESVEKRAKGLQEWKGELYFELHRGTYTSQAPTKRYNRKLEFLLRDVEITSTMSLLLGRDFKYPKSELDSLWKNLLLNQFHDVLPGSAIELANIDARAIYKDIETKASKLLDDSFNSLYQSPRQKGDQTRYIAFNSLGWDRSEIVEIPSHSDDNLQQYSADENTGYVKVNNGAFTFSEITEANVEHQRVQTFARGKDIVMENDWVTAKFNQQGQLISFFDKQDERELIPEGHAGNKLKLFEDIPLYWDAWDVEIYHLNTGRTVENSKARIGEVGPLRSTIVVKYAISEKSTAVQTIALTATSPRLDFHTEVEWHENRTFLKVEFIWDIHSDFATYDSQFGVVQRSTTFNTSQDYAKFEVCGHKFADLSEHGYGVALLNDCKYGYSCHGNVMRLSLLRSPKAPDANCDMGAKNVILDVVKRAEDSDDIILRLHEAYGGRARFKLRSSLNVKSIHRCNILEDDEATLEYNKEEHSSGWLVMHPFEIVTLKIKVK